MSAPPVAGVTVDSNFVVLPTPATEVPGVAVRLAASGCGGVRGVMLTAVDAEATSPLMSVAVTTAV
jgi:hypothetical protein